MRETKCIWSIIVIETHLGNGSTLISIESQGSCADLKSDVPDILGPTVSGWI